jgi:hypothetical protein
MCLPSSVTVLQNARSRVCQNDMPQVTDRYDFLIAVPPLASQPIAPQCLASRLYPIGTPLAFRRGKPRAAANCGRAVEFLLNGVV